MGEMGLVLQIWLWLNGLPLRRCWLEWNNHCHVLCWTTCYCFFMAWGCELPLVYRRVAASAGVSAWSASSVMTWSQLASCYVPPLFAAGIPVAATLYDHCSHRP